MAFSPNGRLAYSTGGPINQSGQLIDGPESAVQVWDVETAEEIGRLDGHTGSVHGLAVSRDGKRILTGGDTTVILWDARTRTQIRRLSAHSALVHGVAFLPDGRHGLSCSLDKTIKLWDIDLAEEIRHFGENLHVPRWLDVSPDGRRVICSYWDTWELRLWDVNSAKLIQRLYWGNAAPVRGSFLRDGHHAIWGGSDGVARVYRLVDPVPAEGRK